MKKKTRKQLRKMMQKGFEPAGFLTGAATALAAAAVLRSKPMHNIEHKVGEKLGEAWPKISHGLSEMTHAANGLLSRLHLGGHHNGSGKNMKSEKEMGKQEVSESFSAPSPRAMRPGRSSRKDSKE